MRTYTKSAIAEIFDVSERTIADDAKHLNLNPTEGDRRLKLFSQADFELISQMRSHCADKSNSRESFVPNTEVEILEPEPTVYKLQTTNSSLTTQKRDVFAESLELGLSQDPLFDLEVLQRIADKHWLLPATRLAAIFGITPKYLNSKQTYSYCGFVASKEVCDRNRILWKITANNH